METGRVGREDGIPRRAVGPIGQQIQQAPLIGGGFCFEFGIAFLPAAVPSTMIQIICAPDQPISCKRLTISAQDRVREITQDRVREITMTTQAQTASGASIIRPK